MKRRPPHVTKYADRHGKTRWRFRKAGQAETQTTLPFDSEEWWDWYFAAAKGAARPIGAARTQTGTFSALIVDYYEALEFKQLAGPTQTTKRGELERFRADHGDKRVVDLKPSHIASMMGKKNSAAAANNMLRALRTLMAFAQSRNWRADNPAAETKRLPQKNKGGHRAWTDAERAQFEAHWAVGTRERLAYDLLLYTSQRSNDVRQMTVGQIADGTITVRQTKTDAGMRIPVHPALQASLAARTSDHLVILSTQYGRPFSPKGFGNWFAEAARAAGLVGCRTHGLRTTMATMLADASCTDSEIGAVTGHKDPKMIRHYVRAANQKSNAVEAMRKVEKTQRERGRV
jgi:integrase